MLRISNFFVWRKYFRHLDGGEVMKTGRYKSGLTLLEILVSVGIIAILTTIMVSVYSRVDYQSNQRLLESTFAILNNCLEQFRDYRYRYRNTNYDKFIFPIDCNGFDKTKVKQEMENALSSPLTTVVVEIGPTDLDLNDVPEYSGCAVMYWFLSRIPDCRANLEKIDKTLITNLNNTGQSVTITVDGIEYPLIRIVDPWDNTLRYDYYDETLDFDEMVKSRRNFPVITSVGPDGQPGTADDIKSR